jgi:dihydrofolate reductase
MHCAAQFTQGKIMALLSFVVAMDRNRLIGRDNALPWHLPPDLKRFKALTLGKPVIMGRKTHESIGRPLPGRRNIVISRNASYAAAGCEVVTGLQQAITITADAEEAMIIGGVTIYESAMPLVQRIHLTLIEAEFTGDAWFPEYDPDKWRVTAEEKHRYREGETDFEYRFVQLDRV